MNALTCAPVAPLLDRLFREADEASPMASPFASLPDEERYRLLRTQSDYIEFYKNLKDFAIPVSRETGTLLYMLVRGSQARSVVEFGTSFGISTLHMAAALRDNGGGRLITTEFEPSKVLRARGNLAAGGLADLVELREGDALSTLATDLPEAIDFVLLDGAKMLYGKIVDLLEPRLRPGALIVADNANFCPEYLDRMRSGGGYMSVPLADDVELSVRLL